MAANPLAFEFLSLFSVECKHRNDIMMDTFIRDHKGTSFLAKTIMHTKEQAGIHRLNWMVIAKQDRYEPILILDRAVGQVALRASSFTKVFKYHVLCNDAYLMMTLDHLIRLTHYKSFVTLVRNLT